MDPEFKLLSIQEKVDAELEIGADEFQVDDIDYDLGIVGSEVHNLPTGFASERLAKSLGNVMAEFLEYDANGHRNFMRIWTIDPSINGAKSAAFTARSASDLVNDGLAAAHFDAITGHSFGGDEKGLKESAV
ncbi:hypothetical protein Golob_019573 [Gossypium lobatum]|uniref:Uncharacterized protein n=1 Tax=Gossypium lobatum TaxID=34289 RepID=A0A7J8L7P9_9ROSI|nr:hypothetical protein [Gossypium lobatum]